MVADQLVARDIDDARVLRAMREVPRHRFVGNDLADDAHRDGALPIGQQQTISQPYIVALMCQALALEPAARVLDVGTGSGYAAAILSRLVDRLYTIERHDVLAETASALLDELGYDNIEARCGDGVQGWPEQAPFDAIMVAAASTGVPSELLKQLAVGGRMVIPVGVQGEAQELLLFTNTGDGVFKQSALCKVRFVPLVDDSKDGGGRGRRYRA